MCVVGQPCSAKATFKAIKQKQPDRDVFNKLAIKSKKTS